ncbi:hypothetical protein MVEG_06019 [Podila verticillata NRRL 6337]|nr:hypothetical protein MVEG_06019 [Podila verticillata NRRL 6337]
MSPMHSPRSPYERHHFTPKRTRLRVDASAATRKAQRALKTLQRRASGVLQEGSDYRSTGQHDTSTITSASTYGSEVLMDAHGRDADQTSLQHRVEEPHRDGKSKRVSITGETSIPSETTILVETRRSQAYDQITPVKRSKSLVKSTRSLGTDFRSRKADVAKPQPTPGSRARDSMTLVSPTVISGPSGLNLDLVTPSPLRSRYPDTSGVSTTKRTSSDMDQSDDIDIHEAEYKRARSSPFLDSVTPVRFGSPERESKPGYRDSLSNLSVEIARKSSLRQSRDAEQYEEGLSFTRASSRPAALLRSDMEPLKYEHDSGEDTIQHSRIHLLKENRSTTIEQPQDNKAGFPDAQILAEEALSSNQSPALSLRPQLIESSALVASVPVDTDVPLSRSRIGMMMAVKRVMGVKSRLMGAPLQSQSTQGPISRWNKQPSSSSLSSTARQSNITGTTSLMPVTGGKLTSTASSTTAKDTPVTEATSASTRILGMTASSSLFRPTIPRAPHPSMKMRSTESSMARSDIQNSARKQVPISKSALTLKKTTRTVLPDSTLTSKTFTSLFPGTNNSVSTLRAVATSPKRDPKRPIAAQQKTRESTPDIPSTMLFTKVSVPVLGEAFKSSGLPERESPKPSTSSQAQKTPLHMFKDEIQKSTDNPSSTASGSKESLVNNPFVVPAPTRPPVLPSWEKNMSQRRPLHEKTILPEILSEDEEEPDNNRSGSSRSSGPKWASWEDLEKAISEQSLLNPEDIFGPLPVLNMAEIFPGKETTTRSRNNSAHWGAADRLTQQEVTKYNEDMGWLNKE